MSNSLIPADAMNQIKKYDDDEFNEVASSGSYLPRMQLMSSNCEQVKQGKFRGINNFAIVSGDSYIDVGAAVDVIVIAWRPTALDTSGDEVISCHDKESDLFASIQAKAQEQDSGCMYGPEFLLYIPEKKQFVTMLFGSKTARRVAPDLRVRMVDPNVEGSGPATITSRTVTKGKYTWQAPEIRECVSELEPPTMETFTKALTIFNNPQTTDLAEAPAEERER